MNIKREGGREGGRQEGERGSNRVCTIRDKKNERGCTFLREKIEGERE